jgi:hypothetical protein
LGVFSALYYVGGNERRGWLIYDNDSNWQFRLGDNAGYIATCQGGTADLNTWYHLVGVYDGTNAILYVNGVAVSTVATGRAFNANPEWPTEIGSASAFSRNFSGIVDEAAIYTNALTPAEILAHYQNGLSASPSTPYKQLVLGQNPAGYWRLNEPAYTPPDVSTLPTVANSGSLGAAAKGTVYPGTMVGVASAPFEGFGANNTAFSFSPSAGNVGLGNPDGLNFTNQITMMAWVKPNLTAGLRDIVAHGYVQSPDQELFMRINAGAYQVGSWEGGSASSAAGLANQDRGKWVFLTGTYDGTTWKLYRYDTMIASATGAGWNTMFADWSIGSRGDNTTDQRYFGGDVDEVAIFDKALTQAEIQQVFWSANVPPMFVQQPQAPAGQVIAGAPVSVAASVTGTPVLGYQWMKDGGTVAGQTTSALTFGNITTNDAGNYTLVVTNAYGAATSSVVTLDVAFPAEPASLVSAVGFPVYNQNTGVATLTQIILTFSGPLGQEGGDPVHYSIPGLTISGARFTNMNSTVILTTAAQTQGATYTVTITGVTDGVGRPLANNTIQFRAWVSSPANGILFEYYYYNQDTAVSALLADPLYPDHPALKTNLWVFDSRSVFPDNSLEQYGARMSGVFIPPTSGNWRFYLRSDDASQLYLNPAGPDPAGAQLLIDETACCGAWDKYQSEAFALIAGQPYYIELLYKEGGGGDYGKVAAKLDGEGYPTVGVADTEIDPASLRGPSIGYPYAPADVGGPLTVVGPASLSVAANHTVVFTAEVTNPSGLPVSYQWLRNGSAIADATASSYWVVPTSTDNGARYSVRVSKIGSVVTTADAVLTVTANTDAPAIASIRGTENLSRFVVSFTELMGTPTTANFTVAGYTTTAVELDSTGTNVIVTLNSPLAPGTGYNLTVQNMPDSAGNILSTTTAPLNTFVFSRGLLRFDYFGKLSYSDNLIYGTLLADPRFPASPDWTGFVTSFDSRNVFPDDQRNGYGARVSGLFIPKTSGNYAFFMKSDDTSLLFVNLNGTTPLDATTETPLLYGETCCHPFSDLAITNGPFVAGQMYYIEADYKEGGGGDYLQVATKPEADETLPNALTPIAGPLLGILADPAGASVTITQEPMDTTIAYQGAGEASTVLLDTTFDSTDAGFTKVDYGSPVGPWSYDSVAGSWTNHGQPNGACGGPFASGLNSPTYTLANAGGVELTFKHRYSFEGYTPSDSTPWDGGQVRVSVNGGPFATVPNANFSQNGYLSQIGGSIIAEVTSTAGWVNMAFVGESAGYSSRQLLTSVCSLGYFNAGDTIRVQFLASWDDCTEGQEPNWEIDSVKMTLGAAVPAVATLTVGAESTYKYEPNPYIAYIWQQDKGSGFADMLDVSGPTNKLTLTLQDSGTKYRCLVYGPGASATSSVATVTVTLPLSIAKTAADTLTLSWPLPTPPMTYTSFLLEQTPSLSPAAWTVVPTSNYQTTSAKVRVNVTPTGSGMYYRLRLNQ